jgi:hypothetical protein
MPTEVMQQCPCIGWLTFTAILTSPSNKFVIFVKLQMKQKGIFRFHLKPQWQSGKESCDGTVVAPKRDSSLMWENLVLQMLKQKLKSKK